MSDDSHHHHADGAAGPDESHGPVCPELAAQVDRWLDDEHHGNPVAGLLSHLDDQGDTESTSWHAPALTDLTLIRMQRAAQAGRVEPELSETDREAVDAWVMDRSGSGELAERIAWLETSAKAARKPIHHDDGKPWCTDPAHTESVFAKIQAARDHAVGTGSRGGFRFRLGDFAAVAAAAVLAFALLIPSMSQFRADAAQAACASNLQAAGLGFGLYGGDYDAHLPVASNCDKGIWWDVGRDPAHSNAANLFTLVREGYTALPHLACPGNASAIVAGLSRDAVDWESVEQVSYSYRIVFGGSPQRLHDDGQAVLVADRSPLVLAALKGRPVSLGANSPNHDGSGQHVLRADGSLQWTTSPVLGEGASRDHLWLPRSIERAVEAVLRSRQPTAVPLRGDETPSEMSDAFVGP